MDLDSQNTHATNADSLIIHEAPKLRDVNFINGGGGRDTSCIIESAPSHTHLTRTGRRMHDVVGQMERDGRDGQTGRVKYCGEGSYRERMA